jgi:hypothetical protein
MKTLSIVFATLLFSKLSLANERGNGGDAVVCRDNNGSIIKAELLDYYEGRALRKIPNVLADSADPEFIRELTERLTTYEPMVFKKYKFEARLMLTAFLNYRGSDIKTPGYVFVDREIEDIQDSMELLMPRGCRVEQLVIRATKTYPEDPSFIVQGEILKALPERDVMGIVIHELIYGAFAIELGHTDSRAARLFHQRLMSQTIDELSFFSYAKHNGEIRTFIHRDEYAIYAFPTPLADGYTKLFTTIGFQGIFNSQGKLDVNMTNKGGETWLQEIVTLSKWPRFSDRNLRNICRKTYNSSKDFDDYSGTLTIKNSQGIEKELTIHPDRLNTVTESDFNFREIVLPFSEMTEVVIDFPAPKTFDARCLPEITFNFILGRDKDEKSKYVDTIKFSQQGYQAKKKFSFGLNEKLELQMTQQ